MSATVTNRTKITRRDAGTDEPRISASNVDAGMPSSALRRSPRFTWSLHARRAFSLSELRFT